uniref:Nephrocystin 3-like N-terminal domain-containing protein n=1 Tax=Moniliophthora roreri TaxID=221103 RepID=A0A0W0GCU4_MONRR
MFSNGQGFRIHGEQYNDHQSSDSVDPLQLLWHAIQDLGENHISETHHPLALSQCHPETYREVLDILQNWINSPKPEERIFWLYGPAGAGKSAIAQTIVENGRRKGYLASSFFFSRADPKRNTPKLLFLSIAYELANFIPELREPIREEINRDPAVLQASLDEQFQKLIVGPCRSLEELHSHPWLIVIGRLDECDTSQEQQHILSIIGKRLPKHVPFRFLVYGRPEPPIREVFDTAKEFCSSLRRVALDETFKAGRDIQTFLTNEFKRIRKDPRNAHIQFPTPWPAPAIVDKLVQKAHGQLIYAATAIKFIDEEHSNPCAQLEHVLYPVVPHPNLDSDSPFYDLDVLYHQILSSRPQRSKLRDIVRALLLIQQGKGTMSCPTPRRIEALLSLNEGEVVTTLHGMHSILDIRGPSNRIRIRHASFGDFLRDARRSGYFFVGNEQNQHGFLACRFLHAIDHYSSVCDGNEDRLPPAQREVFSVALRNWASHCSSSNLDDDVLNALRKVNFTISIGFHIRDHLCARIMSAVRQCDTDSMCKIETFFSQIEILFQRLQADPDVHVDITRRFADYRRGFRVAVQQPDVPTAIVCQILDIAATEISRALVPHPTFRVTELQTLKRTNPEISNVFQPEHFQVISIGNACGCTQLKAITNKSSLPCTEPASVDVYHVQLSVSMRAFARNAMRDRQWDSVPLTLDAQVECGLIMLLNICGPCPELLDFIPPLLSEIGSKTDRVGVFRWLLSFPLEYTLQTFPLIKKVLEVQCEQIESRIVLRFREGPAIDTHFHGLQGPNVNFARTRTKPTMWR